MEVLAVFLWRWEQRSPPGSRALPFAFNRYPTRSWLGLPASHHGFMIGASIGLCYGAQQDVPRTAIGVGVGAAFIW